MHAHVLGVSAFGQVGQKWTEVIMYSTLIAL
jgi:hypothetical protein